LIEQNQFLDTSFILYKGEHPTTTGEIQNVAMRFGNAGDTTAWISIKVQIINCGEYFVYHLKNTLTCLQRYCATN
jgi:hypothetical protein